MKITFLGVGSAFSRKNANSNVLIESGEVKLLIDCARSCPPSLEQYGLSLRDITHVIITHLHSDHITGLEEMALMSKLIYKHKPIIISTSSLLERLWDASLRGGLEYIEIIPGDKTQLFLKDYFELRNTLPKEEFVIGKVPELKICMHPSDHVLGMESYSIEMEEAPGGKTKRFFFSGDTRFDKEMILYGYETCTYLFHDCQLHDSGKYNQLGVHASYNQLCTLPQEIRKKIWLYHYGDKLLPNVEEDGFAGLVTHHQSFLL